MTDILDPTSTAQMAILDYFSGERREMVIIVIVSILLVAAVCWLFLVTRSGLSKGLMITVLISAGLMSGTALSLFVRDASEPAKLVGALRSGPAGVDAIRAERTRVEQVIAKYPLYRRGAAVLGVLALLALLLSERDWIHGVAAALLMLVVSQVLIDHFSEHRAIHYAAQLASRMATTAVP